MTVEEYFQLEENDPDTRYEYIDGHIEIYHKKNNKRIYDAYEDNDEIPLHSLGVHFSLADAYTDVEFEEPAEEV